MYPSVDKLKAQALNQRGELLASEGKFSEAWQSFQAAVRIDPTCSSAQNNLGAILIGSGKVREGLQHYLRTIENGNANGEILAEVNRIITAIEKGEPVTPSPAMPINKKQSEETDNKSRPGENKSKAGVLVHCRACGSLNLLDAYSGHIWTIKHISHPVKYMKCSDCGSLSLLPEIGKAELDRYYDQVYSYGDYRLMKNVKYYQSMERLRRISRYLSSDNEERILLDLGANYGHFLNTARGNGWNVEGIEISNEAIEGARQLYGLNLRQSHLEDFAFAEASFDAITLWHVLEHSSSPGMVIRQAASALKEGGILAIAIPNVASIASKLCGWRWRWLSPPVHLNHLPKSALINICKESGLELVKSITRDNFGSKDILFETCTSGILADKNRKRSLIWKLVKRLEGDEDTRKELPFKWIWKLKTGTHLEWAATKMLEIEPRRRLRSYTRLATLLLHPLIRLLWAVGWGAELEIYFRKKKCTNWSHAEFARGE